MALVAQLLHEPPMVDLGGADRVLHLFACAIPGESTWDPDAGCNAGIVLHKDDLGDALTDAPSDARSEEGGVALNGELWITGWDEYDDGIPADTASAYFDPAQFDALPAALQNPYGFDCRWFTKAGAVPYWHGNGVSRYVARTSQPPYAFLLQLSDLLALPGAVPHPDAIGCDVVRCDDVAKTQMIAHVSATARRANAPIHVMYTDGNDEEYEAHFANFGNGTAYVFIDRGTAAIRWFWER
jgi:hypothetical protein